MMRRALRALNVITSVEVYQALDVTVPEGWQP